MLTILVINIRTDKTPNIMQSLFSFNKKWTFSYRLVKVSSINSQTQAVYKQTISLFNIFGREYIVSFPLPIFPLGDK